MNALTISVPAKVNLHLQVVGRRADGFHELRTLFQSIDLRDRLEGVCAPDGVLELEVTPPGLDLGGDENLVLRAARALWQESGRSPGAVIRLDKTVPIGGGLGGGSADCAAALVLLDQLWEMNLEWRRIHDLAAELGSDVPFFLHGGLALGVGRGHEVFPLPDLDPLGILVLTPAIEVSTAQVFQRIRWNGPWGKIDGAVYASLVGPNAGIDWSELGNDLEQTVCQGWPQVDQGLRALRRLHPLHAAVTGSGASVFAVFAGVDEAVEAASEIGARWGVVPCRTLTREEARLTVRSAEPHGDSTAKGTSSGDQLGGKPWR